MNEQVADKVLGKRIEKSQEWKELFPLLEKSDQDEIKKIGVIAWLSQTGQNEETK